MRPHHLIKSLFVFGPIFFAGKATDMTKLVEAFLAFVAFSALSCSIYFFNDLCDRDKDCNHPEKCMRPIASGSLSTWLAVLFGLIFAAFSVSISFLLSSKVTYVLLVYGSINISYSLWLKHVVIVDIFCIAMGFVLRILAGGYATNIVPTSWLIITTFLLALFLGLTKRRHELVLLNKTSDYHRPVLGSYTQKLVDQLISVAAPVTLITYLLYTLKEETIARFDSNLIYTTGIFVVFGIFRYLYLIHRKDLSGSPTDLVLNDLPLLSTIIGWILTFSLIVYFK
jgi:4-hydroxybenzoate polyprenyltransferase